MKEHIHKLKKHTYANKTQIYFCVLNCNYKIEVPLAIGKEVLCNLCDRPFIMNESHLKRIRPHCNNCGKRRIKDSDGRIRYVREIFAGTAEQGLKDIKGELERLDSVREEI